MRNEFRSYYRPTDEEFDLMWREGVFVFDTNIFLNLYRYSEETSNSLLTMMDNLKKQLWLPYQVAREYQNRRVDEIFDRISACEDPVKEIRKQLNACNEDQHVLNKNESIIKELGEILKKVEDFCKSKKLKYENLLKDDYIRDRLTSLFEYKVGNKYSKEKLEQIYGEGENRYKEEIPPGYKDKDKHVGKFGDLILWYQIVEKVKQEKAESTPKPFVLVTDDKKEDWWLRKHGKTIGPRIELIEEILSAGAISFHMYSSHQFLQKAGLFFKLDVAENTIKEIQDVENLTNKVEESPRNILNRLPFSNKITSVELDTLEAMLEGQVTLNDPIDYYTIKQNLYRRNYEDKDINFGIRSLLRKNLIIKGETIEGFPSFTMTEEGEEIIMKHLDNVGKTQDLYVEQEKLF